MSLLSVWILLIDSPTPTHPVPLAVLVPLTRHDDLKEMLDTNKDSLKLEAMKRIVAVRRGPSLGGGLGGPWPLVDHPLLSAGLLPSSSPLTLTPQMIARGKNASDLFPAVVKNVACKNIEVSAPPP